MCVCISLSKYTLPNICDINVSSSYFTSHGNIHTCPHRCVCIMMTIGDIFHGRQTRVPNRYTE